jgi:acyl-CoA synthetase (NDP forming)
VILYRAGRTAEGARASASHTAAIAGDAIVSRELAANAGVVVAESLEEFEDLVKIFTLLHGRSVGGRRIAAMSNAGFETVAFADALGRLQLASPGEATREAIGDALRACRLEKIVTIANPLDVNPMMSDEPFAVVFRTLLRDDAVDAAIVGAVPLTPALATLPPDDAHREDLHAGSSIASRLVEIWNSEPKPWCAVVDSGPLYDPMVRVLEEGGIPTFRSADRALRRFGRWVEWRSR